MRRTIVCATALLVLCVTAAFGQEVKPVVTKSPVDTPQRVLFIGNSLMYISGGLQTHVHRLAAAGTPPLPQLRKGFKSVHITSAGLDEYPIEYLVTPGHLGIKEPFQIVILAGHAQDSMKESTRSLYRQKVVEFDAIIKKHGGRTALLWLPAVVKPNPQADTDMAKRTQDMMMSVGNEVGALIIPVGLAFQEAQRQRPDLPLRMEYDGNHNNPAGQYLAACVVYASLYGLSPVGNPYDFFGRIDKQTTAFLQKVAENTVRKFYGH